VKQFEHPELLKCHTSLLPDIQLPELTDNAADALSEHVSSRSSSFRRKSAIGIIEPGMRSFDPREPDIVHKINSRLY